MKINHFGALYIVATPIGNISDWSERAVNTLQSVDCIAAEDTRHSLPLLQHFSIKTPLISLHEHNERERVKEIMSRLQQGQSIALISDAGTPLISDPGYSLVSEARQWGVKVIPIPGACAAIAALSASGLPANRFCFEGFLPHKKGRQTLLKQLALEERTIILYESPHRLVKTLEQIREFFGERIVSVSRELTKMHEETFTASVSEVLTHFQSKEVKGEIVIVIDGKRE